MTDILLSTNRAFTADPFTIGSSAIFVLIVVVLAVLLVFKGVKTVPQGYQYTVERFG